MFDPFRFQRVHEYRNITKMCEIFINRNPSFQTDIIDPYSP